MAKSTATTATTTTTMEDSPETIIEKEILITIKDKEVENKETKLTKK
jgi:hypothetical protein